MKKQPAGWYRDTEKPNLHRYWTGERWSDRLGEELAVLERTRVPAQKRADQCPDACRGDHLDERACG